VTQAAKAGVKAAGVVIDDAAVTPRYLIGFAAQRELPTPSWLKFSCGTGQSRDGPWGKTGGTTITGLPR
jgi:hypothetical protein